MKWVEIGGTHINTDHLECFSWFDGDLHLFFHRERSETRLKDPNRRLYTKLCHQLGVRPYYEEVQGDG